MRGGFRGGILVYSAALLLTVGASYAQHSLEQSVDPRYTLADKSNAPDPFAEFNMRLAGHIDAQGGSDEVVIDGVVHSIEVDNYPRNSGNDVDTLTVSAQPEGSKGSKSRLVCRDEGLDGRFDLGDAGSQVPDRGQPLGREVKFDYGRVAWEKGRVTGTEHEGIIQRLCQGVVNQVLGFYGLER